MTAPLKIPAPAPLPRELRKLGVDLSSLPRFDDGEEIEDEATLMWRGSNLPGNRVSGFAAPEVAPFAFSTEGKEEDSTLITKPNLADPRIMRSDRPPAPRAPSSSVRPVARSAGARSAAVRRVSSVPAAARPASSRPIVAPPASPRPILASPTSNERSEASALIPAAALALLGQTTRAAAEAQAAAAASLLNPSRSAPPVPRQVLAEPTPEPEVAENTPPPVPSAHLVSSLRPSASDWDESVIYMQPRPRRRWLGAVAVGVVAAVAAAVVVMNPEQSAVLVDRLVASGAALVASIR